MADPIHQHSNKYFYSWFLSTLGIIVAKQFADQFLIAFVPDDPHLSSDRLLYPANAGFVFNR
jgi:hypothetical protein